MFNVLVVEDDPMVAQLHEHYLGQITGFQFGGLARNGADALKMLEKKNFDLIILDVFMPGMDGLQFLAKVREKGYDVDVIMVTAANENDKIKQGLRLGAVDYIIKPFEFERFNLALSNYQNRHRIVEDQNMLQQEQLDKAIIHQEKVNMTSLPKGLDKHTLMVVWEKICSFEEMFSTEEVSAKVGISRVSIRKYLEFLKNIGLLKLDLHRGSVGRPVYKYLCVDKKSDLLNVYTH